MLKRTYDRKTTTMALGKADLRAKIGNAFGLVAGLSCPGATSACLAVCYASKIERIFACSRKIVMNNFDLLKSADFDTTVDLLTDMLNEFVNECDKYGSDKIFRIHWDGDFFSMTYTMAWACVMERFDSVRFWTYTRNARAAMALSNIANLSLYFSADCDNIDTARHLAADGIKIATMTDTFADGRQMMQDINGKNGIACPEQVGKIPLIAETGGACANCKLCLTGNNNIRFATSKG